MVYFFVSYLNTVVMFLNSHSSVHSNKAAEPASSSQHTTQMQSSSSIGVMQLKAAMGDPTIPLSPSQIMQLHKTIGNRATTQFMKSRLPSVPTVQRVKEPEDTAGMEPIQQKENHTGMPDHLKSGLENLSGMDLSDVKVHYNSDKPSQVEALAYAQGNDIHLGPGQEEHLPHEGWHVVQQKQGRVQPTLDQGGTLINDDVSLEQEADARGAEAVQRKALDHTRGGRELQAAGTASSTMQRLKVYPPTQDKEDTDFNANPQEVDLSKASYEQLCKYFTIREQQLRSGVDEKLPRRGMPERNMVFDDSEFETMKKRIKAFEAGTDGLQAVATVNCYEGQIKVLSALQEGNFGGVSSCMTITVVMKNGKKVIAHAGVEAPVTFNAIKDVVDSVGAAASVKAAGVGLFWGTNLEPYGGLTSVQDDENEFKQNLNAAFGCAAEFENLEGTIKVAPDGTVSL